MNGKELKRTVDLHKAISRVYRDDRFFETRVGNLRHLVITTLWVCAEGTMPPGERWQRVCELMHLNGTRFWWLISEDAPRYVPPNDQVMVQCEAPMIRRPGPCGKRCTNRFKVADPATGEWRWVGYCTRHEDIGKQVWAAERKRIASGTTPKPMPNRGGLLPCYIVSDWPEMYRKARPAWEPPALGICADDWPTMRRVAEQKPPELKVHFGGADATSGETAADDTPAPALRLLRGDE